MSSSATALAGKNETFNFVNVFNNPEQASDLIEPSAITVEEANRSFTTWLNNSGIVTAVASATIGGKSLPNDRLLVTFALQNAYNSHFVLLRGLLEFSHPKGIAISSDALDRTFQVRISADQVGGITQYLNTIFGWLQREIRFKTSLKAIIQFEDKVRQIQATLYQALSATV